MAPFKAYKIQPDDFKHEADVEEGSNTNINNSEFDSNNDEDERSSLLSSSASSGASFVSSEINPWTLEIQNEEDRVMYERDNMSLGLKVIFFR